MKPAASAVWRICWSRTQKSATPIVVRLVSFDNGGGNIVELGRISSANWPAGIETSNIGIDITRAFNGLVNAKVFKNVGWQVEGDGVSPASFYLSRLELQLEDQMTLREFKATT